MHSDVLCALAFAAQPGGEGVGVGGIASFQHAGRMDAAATHRRRTLPFFFPAQYRVPGYPGTQVPGYPGTRGAQYGGTL
eukprot:3368752-Rhodomonas_salina.1